MVNVNMSAINFEQLPHYCTQAIEKFTDLAERLRVRLGIAPDFELLLRDLMQQAVKYMLPENARLFSEDDFKPWMFDRQELPHSVCALEFSATRELYAENSNLAFSGKRIVLCFDPWLLPPEQIARLSRLGDDAFLEGEPLRCLAVMVVYEANGLWNPAVGVVLIDLDAARPVALKDVAPDSPLRALNDRASVRLQCTREPSKHALPAAYRTFPARSMLVGLTAEQAREALYLDTLDEVRAGYKFLAAINSSQVRTYEVLAPAKLNDKRRRNGRAPFFSYKVLDL